MSSTMASALGRPLREGTNARAKRFAGVDMHQTSDEDFSAIYSVC